MKTLTYKFGIGTMEDTARFALGQINACGFKTTLIDRDKDLRFKATIEIPIGSKDDDILAMGAILGAAEASH